VVCPLQIGTKETPALAVTHRRKAIVIPAKIRGAVFTLQFNPPNPVAPMELFVAHAAPITGALLVPL
jgi:hypothetical protein